MTKKLFWHIKLAIVAILLMPHLSTDLIAQTIEPKLSCFCKNPSGCWAPFDAKAVTAKSCHTFCQNTQRAPSCFCTQSVDHCVDANGKRCTIKPICGLTPQKN